MFLWGVAFGYLGPALLLQSTATRRVGGDEGATFAEFWGDVMWTEWALWAGAIVWTLLFLYAAVKSLFWRSVVAVGHTIPHIFVVGSAVALSAWLLDLAAQELGEGNRFRNGVIEGDLTVALVGVALAIVPGAVVVGAYLVLMDGLGWVLDRWRPGRSQRFPRHVMELFAAQRITGHKNFLRMHIDGTTGALTIYPIAVPKAAKFEFPSPDDPRQALIVPKEPVAWRLIEQPIAIDAEEHPLADPRGNPVN